MAAIAATAAMIVAPIPTELRISVVESSVAMIIVTTIAVPASITVLPGGLHRRAPLPARGRRVAAKRCSAPRRQISSR